MPKLSDLLGQAFSLPQGQQRTNFEQNYLIANLPAQPIVGMKLIVTDGDANLAWGDEVINSGAGATTYLIWWNGTKWTVLGK